MLLALPNVGLERMGRKNSSGYAGIAFLGALRAQNPKTQKPKNPKTQKPTNLPAAGRQNSFRLLRFFPAHSGQPAAEKRR